MSEQEHNEIMQRLEGKPTCDLYLVLMSHPIFKSNPYACEAIAELIYQSGYHKNQYPDTNKVGVKDNEYTL